MQRPDIELGERAYTQAHIEKVLKTFETNFPSYFDSFYSNTSAVQTALQKPRDDWDRDHQAYVEFLDVESLEEFEEDPNAFKSTFKKCPIVRRCLNSKVDEMKDYKIKFNMSTGDELLCVTQNLANFAINYQDVFNEEWPDGLEKVSDLGLEDLQTEDYTAYGVIGGGIKSHFLYSLYPHVFPNRSQSAIWAMYYLSGKDDFGFEDGSEFLMMHNSAKGAIIHQNYHYPYDLFTYYALHIYRWFDAACRAKGISLDSEWRFIHLEAFFKFIEDKNREEISLLKGKEGHEYFE